MGESLEEYLDRLFTYHAPKGDQPARYQAIRSHGRALASVIMSTVPDCPEREQAMNLLRLAIMSANQGIACNE
jgi:hypothetical protein